ncbi:MAG: molybdopterin-dependent oxidoreductase [Bryobacteraceae bacterium]|nr:molybdopterin-dependent oxidoreductase [Bryobacteraceae bacterium]
MSRLSRRQWILAGLGATAGGAAAIRAASANGLIPPNARGLYTIGDTLTYASHRLLTRHSMAREFSREQISTHPFPNSKPPDDDIYKRHQAAAFADWRLSIDGLVARPVSFSLADLRQFTPRSQITQLICEEGWSFIAEWTGASLADVLQTAQILPQAKYVVYFSHDKYWWDSLDMEDARHPQTLVTYGMNGGLLPPGHGGPLRLRVPRQLGYKSVKYITRLTATDNIKAFGSGLGSGGPDFGYSWYAGI